MTAIVKIFKDDILKHEIKVGLSPIKVNIEGPADVRIEVIRDETSPIKSVFIQRLIRG